jgi:hypothetical protein
MSQSLSSNLPTEVPLTHDVDIFIAGGGPGGIGAAVAAGRKGKKVLLAEHYGFLGGMATAGEVNPFMPNHHEGDSLDKGIFEEWLARIKEYNPGGNGRIFDPNAARLAAEDLCIEAGVQLLYHHRVVAVSRTGSKIEHVILHSKSGMTAVKAKVFIDSTGDGDMAQLAGAEFEMGGFDTPHVQPMTLCFKLKLNIAETGLDYRDAVDAVAKERGLIQESFKKAQENGETSNPRENVLTFATHYKDVVHFNTTRVIKKSSVNGSELSDAEVEARKQMRELITILRRDVPCFQKATIHSVAPQIGIRESRRVVGHYMLTQEDHARFATFPDAVARVTYPIDIHNPNGTGTEIRFLPKGTWYEIPYRCIVAKGIENLLMGSRCISVDHGVHSSVRVMPPVCSIGQAAGTAAALAVEGDCDCISVDGVALNDDLKSQGRSLVEYDPNREWGDLEPGNWQTIQRKERKGGVLLSS